MLRISYYDRQKKEMVSLEIPTDVVAVHIPPEEGQPALVVNVNTDAVLVDTATGEKVAMYEFTELLSDAEIEPERLLVVQYQCPNCEHLWQEEWSCACDSECPKCDTRNITALSWGEAGSE